MVTEPDPPGAPEADPPSSIVHPAPATKPRTPRSVLLAAIVMVATSPVLGWWMIGPLDETVPGPDPDDYDRLFEPLHLSGSTELTIGITATGVTIVTLMVLVGASITDRFDPRWWFPIIGFAAAGAAVGFGYRVVTAAVIGANIGGGMVLVFGIPVVAATLVGSTAWAVHIIRTRADRDPGPTAVTAPHDLSPSSGPAVRS